MRTALLALSIELSEPSSFHCASEHQPLCFPRLGTALLRDVSLRFLKLLGTPAVLRPRWSTSLELLGDRGLSNQVDSSLNLVHVPDLHTRCISFPSCVSWVPCWLFVRTVLVDLPVFAVIRGEPLGSNHVPALANCRRLRHFPCLRTIGVFQ